MDVVVEVDKEEKRPGRPRKTWKQCVDSDIKACKLTPLIGLDGEKLSRIAYCCLPLFQGIRNGFFLFYPQQYNIKPDTN